MDKRRVVSGKQEPAKNRLTRSMRQNMTVAEQALWEAIRGNRCCRLHFRRQQVIDGFIVDFYCHRAGIVIEVDGTSHLERERYDAQREGVLRTRGLRILRFTNEQVIDDLNAVLQDIARDSEHS